MKRKSNLFGALLVSSLLFSSCSMMVKMMGMEDLMSAMENMDKMMAKSASEKRSYVKSKQSAALATGEKLFNDPLTGEGTNGLSCNSCHPSGTSTGGEAQIPMREYKIPIPSLVGASSSFPKYKIPNDAVITLQQMNNNCMRMFMSGKGLDLNTPEAWSLETYVASLSNGETVQVGGMMSQSQ
ncbi:MAG: hypothetical protein IIB40_04110 [Candidatus Marinimicrobia bacterium]|nr:hypothetical protein [Candidatus Neomarinimicrobiota bacterium]MCH7955014.1 hypothetical protein [Candidatus Neomarinimicrobiota bacterium]